MYFVKAPYGGFRVFFKVLERACSRRQLGDALGRRLRLVGDRAAGVVRDVAAGPARASAWTAMFILLAAAILLGPVALWWWWRGG